MAGPRREVYENESNEIEQQYAQHNLDKDMRDAYRLSLADNPLEHARKLKANNRGLLLLLAIIVLVFAVILATS